MKNFILGTLTLAILSVGLSIAFAQLQGKAGNFVLKNESEKVMSSLISTKYESHEYATAGADTALSLQAGAFATVQRAHFLILRFDAPISVKFNNIANDSISMTTGESPFIFNALEFTDLFITGAANVKVIIQ